MTGSKDCLQVSALISPTFLSLIPAVESAACRMSRLVYDGRCCSADTCSKVLCLSGSVVKSDSKWHNCMVILEAVLSDSIGLAEGEGGVEDTVGGAGVISNGKLPQSLS
jgi:hypothetical protein